MKKLLTFAALAAAICSCTNEYEAPADFSASDNAIRFESPVVSPATRAGETESGTVAKSTNYPSNWTFGVSAKWYAEGTTAENKAWNVPTTTYMDQVECAYNSDVKAFDPASVTGGKAYYWPKQGCLTFQAWSPYSENSAVTIADDGSIKFTDYTVKIDGSQTDLMYSERVLDQKKGEPSSHYNGGINYEVQLNFKHALSSIVFKAKRQEAYTGVTITIDSIQLMKAYNQGSFSYTVGAAAANFASSDPTWTLPSPAPAKVDYHSVVLAANPYAIPEDINEHSITDIKDLLVMPQVFADNNDLIIRVVYRVKIGENPELTYTFDQKVNALKYTEDSTETLGTESGFGFKPGRQYTYLLTFALEKIYFNPSVTNWTDVTVTGGITVD